MWNANFLKPFFSLLDQHLHTAANLIWTDHFLFTVSEYIAPVSLLPDPTFPLVCATAAKFYTARPELHQLCTDFAHDAAGQALVSGAKTLETVQAYMVLGVYPTPKRRWADDRSWEFMGLAIRYVRTIVRPLRMSSFLPRLALELELQKPLPSGMVSTREGLNRIRTWLNLLCVDASHAVQFGKVPMLQLMDDYVARTCDEWYIHELNTPFDVHLTAYVKLLIIMSRWKILLEEYGRGHLPGVSATHSLGVELGLKNLKDFDIIQESIHTQEALQTELDVWVARYNEELIYRRKRCSYPMSTTYLDIQPS